MFFLTMQIKETLEVIFPRSHRSTVFIVGLTEMKIDKIKEVSFLYILLSFSKYLLIFPNPFEFFIKSSLFSPHSPIFLFIPPYTPNSL